MNTWLIVVLMVGAAAIVGVPTIAVILLTGTNDEDDSARPVPTLSQPAVTEPGTHILNVAIADGGGMDYHYNFNDKVCYTGEGPMFRTRERLEPVPAETGAVLVLQLPDPTGDVPCLAAAV